MKKYKKIILYYFTGTGNSLKASRWISQEATKYNVETKIYAIDNNLKVDPNDIDDETLIGFLSATHGFNIAPLMLKFILKFPSICKTDVFILNTRAGLKFSKIFFPGLSGAAQFLPMIILKIKGYKIVGGLPLDMPSNWLFIHPGLNNNAVNAISNRCEKITKNFTNKIIDGKKYFRKMLITLPIDIALLPITFAYYFVGRFVLAKTMIYTSNCNNCKICVNNCPVNAIKIKNNRPYWTFSCESCMRCVNLCPRKSIQTSHFIFTLIMISYIFGFNYLFIDIIKLQDFMNYDFIISISKILFTIIETFILYFIIQRFMKNKIISSIIKYTSFSTYWRRYLAPDISLKDFVKKKKNS